MDYAQIVPHHLLPGSKLISPQMYASVQCKEEVIPLTILFPTPDWRNVIKRENL